MLPDCPMGTTFTESGSAEVDLIGTDGFIGLQPYLMARTPLYRLMRAGGGRKPA
jgi:hypothetical protein